MKNKVYTRKEVEKLCRDAFRAGCDKEEALVKLHKEFSEGNEDEAFENFDKVLTENNWIKENL